VRKGSRSAPPQNHDEGASSFGNGGDGACGAHVAADIGAIVWAVNAHPEDCWVVTSSNLSRDHVTGASPIHNPPVGGPHNRCGKTVASIALPSRMTCSMIWKAGCLDHLPTYLNASPSSSCRARLVGQIGESYAIYAVHAPVDPATARWRKRSR